MKKFYALIVSLSLGLPVFANDGEEISFSSQQVAPGIYVISGKGGFAGGNIGLSVGEDGVVMIDDSMPPFLGKITETIKTITKKPVDFLINTHVHGDHVGNNAEIAESGTHIVAHEQLRSRLKKQGLNDKPAPKAALPVITFSKDMHFHLNGETAHIFHVDDAHTDGDAVIHFAKANVVHMGDVLFHGMFPFIDLDNGGSVEGFIAAQEKVLAMVNSKTKIIPGHGELTDKRGLAKDLAMLKDAKEIIAKLVKAGKSEEEVVSMNPLAKYHDAYNWGFITTERMTRQLFKGLSMKKKVASSNHHGHQN